MEFTPDTMRHVARLARLRLDDEEFARLERDVEAILGFFETLADVAGAESETRPPGALREDVLEPSPEHEALLANVPSKGADGRLRVGRWDA